MRAIVRLRFSFPTSSLSITRSYSDSSYGLTVTDPLAIYRSYVARGILSPDPSQHRAAIVIQKVHERLLDYTPPNDYSAQLQALTKALKSLDGHNDETHSTTRLQHSIRSWRDNPLLPVKLQSPLMQTKALVKVMSDEEKLLSLDTPQGLLLYGEVGTGKSMLMDILANSIPYAKKERQHFNAFMLGVYADLETHRRNSNLHDTYSLLYIAQNLISRSTLLFLDELQFPDRASSIILRYLLCYFFQLGGVLVATSNRRPEDMFDDWRKAEFGVFEEILKHRCEVYDMRSNIDWRRQDETRKTFIIPPPNSDVNTRVGREVSVPVNYFLQPMESEESWNQAVLNASTGPESEWQKSSLTVYSRKVQIPAHRNDAALFSFDELCVQVLGPADYLAIASSYPILIIHSVPILTARNHRHEARRFITLLDAIYESRCKLLVQAAAPIEDLFFPDVEDESGLMNDSIHSEAFSEAYQDLVEPFRPNISVYKSHPENPKPLEPVKGSTITNSSKTIQDHADEDSEFDGRIGKADFTHVGKYHGEDEKFAFKRAVSRLQEVCGARWWAIDKGKDTFQPTTFHLPIKQNMRVWERDASSFPLSDTQNGETEYSEHFLVNNKLINPTEDGVAQKLDTNDSKDVMPPKFAVEHIWGVVKWGKRAGKWGQGVDAYNTPKREEK